MSIFRTWLFGIVAAAMALSILYALVPKGAVLTVAKCTGGLIMLLVVIRPLLALEPDALALQYDRWEQQIRQQTEAYSADYQQELTALIQQETAAYISEKADGLGLVCCPQVSCQLREGVPFPAEVTLDIPWDASLSGIIAEELGIGAEHQYWRETE